MDWNNINRDRDTSGLGPIEYDQSKVPQLIRKHADNVRTKTYGQEVREAQARNAEYAGLIASEAEIKADNANLLSQDTQNRFNDQIAGNTNINEVIDARRAFGSDSAYTTLGNRLDTEYQKTIENLNGIGVSPLAYGATGNGITPDTQAIISAFEHGDYVLLPQGRTYIIDEEVEIPRGKILDFNNSKVKFLNGKSSFNISPNSTLRNTRVLIDGSIYQDNPILNFDGNKQFFLGNTETHMVQNVTAEKTSGEYSRQGAFIHFNATQANVDKAAIISGVQFENVKSFRFEYGIRTTLKGIDNSEETSYVTGNVINGYHSYHPSKAIWEDDVVGNRVQLSDNHYEDVQVQADHLPITFLRLVGRLNVFRSFIPWDYHRATNTDQFIIKGSYNHIEGTMPSYDSELIQDTGFRNTIISTNTGVSTYKIQSLVTEFTPRTQFEGSNRLIPISLFRSLTVVNSQTTSSELMSFSYGKKSIPTGVSTFEFEAFGNAKVGSSRSFNLYLNGIYLSGGTVPNAQPNSFVVNVRLMISRYDDKQITVSSLLKTSDGQQFVDRRFVDITNADTIDILVNFHSGASGDMSCYYREANLVKP